MRKRTAETGLPTVRAYGRGRRMLRESGDKMGAARLAGQVGKDGEER